MYKTCHNSRLLSISDTTIRDYNHVRIDLEILGDEIPRFLPNQHFIHPPDVCDQTDPGVTFSQVTWDHPVTASQRRGSGSIFSESFIQSSL